MKLSVVIPAHNEEGAIASTVQELDDRLGIEGIDHEILVVNDHSTDGTEGILVDLSQSRTRVRFVNNEYAPGFGLAVRYGLERFTGEAVAIFMADASDRPEDLVLFFRTLVNEGVDCVFGSRFIKGGRTVDYPWPKLVLNRLANRFISMLFGIPYNDTTNAFKLYRREVIAGLQPILSPHFNITVELPLKAIIRGYTYRIVPNSWVNRKTGVSKLRIKEMGARYLFIVLYCLIEKWLSMGDFRSEKVSGTSSGPSRVDAAERRKL